MMTMLLGKPSLRYSEVYKTLQKVSQFYFKNASSLVSSSLATIVCNGKSVSCVNVQWGGGNSCTFSPLHLRDSCRCSACFDSEASFQRRFSSNDIAIDTKPQRTWICNDLLLHVKWGDGHESSFSSSRLQQLSEPIQPPQVEYFDSALKIPRFHFGEILEKKCKTKEWLQTVRNTGLAIIDGVPQQSRQIHKIGNIVSHLRTYNYGETFQVKWKPSPNNYAYTSDPFTLHTDLTFFDYMPGIQLLHCIQQAASGGESKFSDGFKAAETLKNQCPESYELLSSINWNFVDVGFDGGRTYHQESSKPVIQLDVDGNPHQIAFSDHGRADLCGLSAEKTHMLYEAFLQFGKIINRKDMVVYHKLRPGQCVTMDNRRVFHGRESFSTTRARHLEGGYIDWDEANSFLRTS